MKVEIEKRLVTLYKSPETENPDTVRLSYNVGQREIMVDITVEEKTGRIRVNSNNVVDIRPEFSNQFSFLP